MLAPEIGGVVGIDVAKQAHVVCAVEAPSGALRHPSSRSEATAEGHAQLRGRLQTWADGGTPRRCALGWRQRDRCGSRSPTTSPARAPRYGCASPRQTSSWAASRGLRSGWAPASTLPSDSVPALRALTRASRDLIVSRTAARQRLHDELVVLFPARVRALPRLLPGRTDQGQPAILQLVSTWSSAQALAHAPLEQLSAGQQWGWGAAEAQALQNWGQKAPDLSRGMHGLLAWPRSRPRPAGGARTPGTAPRPACVPLSRSGARLGNKHARRWHGATGA
jgi:hypothetical protein